MDTVPIPADEVW